MTLPDSATIVEKLGEILPDLSERPYPILPSPENCKRRASVAFIIRSKPNYSHWPQSNQPGAKTVGEFFSQDWVRHGEPEVLFIKRASRKGDRWTSHIALPGGRRDPEDEDDQVTAIRETLEEVGLDLKEHAIGCGNLPQRMVTAHWGKKPLMILCPYIFLVTSHELPPLKLQPTEVAATHWVPIRKLLDPAQRTVVFEDVSSRLAHQETGLRRWMFKMLVGHMMFACINLAPSESVHANDSPADGVVSNRYQQKDMCTRLCAIASRIVYADFFNQYSRHMPQEGVLELWGLTLGVISDFLDLLPPHDALTLWTYPTFTPPDVRFAIWLATYRFRNRKRAELQAGTVISTERESNHRFHRPSYGFASESVVMVERPRTGGSENGTVSSSGRSGSEDVAVTGPGRHDETGLHGLGSGYITDRQAAVSTMLEGSVVQTLVRWLLPEITDRGRYYDILRKAVAVSVAGRLAVLSLGLIWGIRRVQRSRSEWVKGPHGRRRRRTPSVSSRLAQIRCWQVQYPQRRVSVQRKSHGALALLPHALSLGSLGCSHTAHAAKIPFNFGSNSTTAGSSSARPPANIPLHSLSSSHRYPRRLRRSSSSYDEKDGDRQRLRRASDTDDGSEGSLWSDTGDLVDQLAEEEDPFADRVGYAYRSEGDHHSSPHGRGRGGRQKKRVHYAQSPSSEREKPFHLAAAGPPKRKEDIRIPSPPPRRINRAERLLATVMAPGDGPSRMHGLHGQKLIYFLSIFVSLGVFLFGYDQGVMSGIITGPYFKDYFHQPSSAEIGTMVAILEIGALISSLVVGRIGDLLGRRRTIFYGACIFVVGGACQTFATGMPMMMLGRIIAGLGVGALSTIVPVYQSEISPPHNRGKLACIEFSGNIFGYLCSVWVDYFCTYISNDWSWRIPLLVQCIGGGLLAVGSFLIVESPRWLLDNDHDEEGIVVIANLYGKGDIHNPKARDEYREIKMNVLLQRQEGERSYRDMFKRYYKRVFIAMSAQALAQLNGINVISYYAPLVFEQAGWAGRQAILMTGINAITYLASTIPPWYLVDRLGRRFILLSGAVAMAISLSLISYFIHIDISSTPTLVVIFVMIYNAAFGYSWGPIPWLYPPEILPLSIRAKGASLSTASNWAFNWLVGEMTPILQDLIQWRLYLLHAFFCALSFVVVWFIYPETANVRLEDMNSIFGDATTAAPTPATLAEAESLFSGNRSPIGSLRLNDEQQDPNVPDIDLQPPDVEIQDGKPMLAKDTDSQNEGVGGWISSMVKRGKGDSANGSAKYKRVGQDEDED